MTPRTIIPTAVCIFRCGMPSAADVILDHPHDFVGALASDEDTAVPFARTADDFVFNRFVFSPIFRAEFVASFPNLPEAFIFEIYVDSGEGPGEFIQDFPVSEVVDRGPWNGNPELHLLELVFSDTSLAIPPGQYWFSAYAVGNGSGSDRGFWGTSGEGSLNGSEGYFMSEHFGVPVWTPVSDPRALGFASDFAFTIEGVSPAPGGLAILAGAAMVQRRRRIWSAPQLPSEPRSA